MQLVTSRARIEEGDVGESIRATIKANPAMFAVLSRDLYPDAPRAVFREILINAIDAHIEAGVSRPVQVTLPTSWSETFSIRDFGRGLTRDQFMSIYMDYGESTRSGDNERHGGLGLGSKSPLAYTDSFTVVSYNGGEASTYLVYYDDEGFPTRSFLSATPSDETGLEVRFTTRSVRDYSMFHRAAMQVLPHIPAHWYKLNGPDLSIVPVEYDRYGDVLMVPRAPARDQPELAVKMGFYLYKVDVALLREVLATANIAVQLGAFHLAGPAALDALIVGFRHLVLDLPIGSVQVHPSRESIILTKVAAREMVNHLAGALRFMSRQTAEGLDLRRDLMLARAAKTSHAPFYLGDAADKPMRSPFLYLDSDYSSVFYRQRVAHTYAELLASIIEVHDRTSAARKPLSIRAVEVTTDEMRLINSLTRINTEWRKVPGDDGATKLIIPYIEEYTPPAVLDLLRRLPVHDTKLDLREPDQQTPSSPYYTQRIAVRGPVTRSFQDPSHNLLILNYADLGSQAEEHTEVYRRYRFGGMKKDWSSGAFNAAELTAHAGERPVFLIPTRMGVFANEEFHKTVHVLLHIRNLIPASWMPVIVGLPASKGTKKIEAAFPGGATELTLYVKRLLASDYLQRRLFLADMYIKLGSFAWLDTGKLADLLDWAPAEKLARFAAVCRGMYSRLMQAKHASFHTVIGMLDVELPEHPGPFFWERVQLFAPVVINAHVYGANWCNTTRDRRASVYKNDDEFVVHRRRLAAALAAQYAEHPTGARWKAHRRHNEPYKLIDRYHVNIVRNP
jgi:hypothetical protein